MQIAESKYGIKKATTFSDFDVLIICVSTHRPDDIFTPQVDGFDVCCRKNIKRS